MTTIPFVVEKLETLEVAEPAKVEATEGPLTGVGVADRFCEVEDGGVFVWVCIGEDRIAAGASRLPEGCSKSLPGAAAAWEELPEGRRPWEGREARWRSARSSRPGCEVYQDHGIARQGKEGVKLAVPAVEKGAWTLEVAAELVEDKLEVGVN